MSVQTTFDIDGSTPVMGHTTMSTFGSSMMMSSSCLFWPNFTVWAPLSTGFATVR